VERIAAEVGITFCFAPVFHPALRHSAVPRRELGVATTFNFLGPLANPARPAAQAVGVADPRMAPLIAKVLSRRGVEGFVFRGDDGLDELTTTTTSTVWAIARGEVTEHVLDPAHLGLPRAAPADLVGGDVATNTAVVRRVLAGESGPVRDAVLLNAAAGIAALDTGDATLTDRLADGMGRAAAAVDTGAAKAKLEQWVGAVEAG
jgi:anthranilate phosphoribosyltransferase